MPIVTTSTRKSSRRSPPSLFRLLLVATALAVITVCAIRRFAGSGASRPHPGESCGEISSPSVPRLREIAPPSAPSSRHLEAEAPASMPEQRPVEPSSASAPGAPSAVTPVTAVSGGGTHVTNEAPHDPDNPDLNSGFGQMLSMLQSVELGDDPTPFPDPYGESETGNEDFAASETNLIVIAECEAPETERRKEAVAWAKVDIREYIKAGGTARGALQELYAFQKECAKLRTDAADDFRDWLRENPKDEEVLAALEEFNGKLKAEGIKPLTVEEILPFEEEEEKGP